MALKAAKTDKGLRPVISIPLEETGLTADQALELCVSLNGNEHIAAWLSGERIQTNIEYTKKEE